MAGWDRFLTDQDRKVLETWGKTKLYGLGERPALHRNRTPGFFEDVPYVVALVELEEGIKVLSNIVDCDPASVAIGDPVEVDFAVTPDGAWGIPLFKPR